MDKRRQVEYDDDGGGGGDNSGDNDDGEYSFRDLSRMLMLGC